MPVVRISDATLVDLRTLSKWIEVDTPSKTIEALVQEKMSALDLVRDTPIIEQGGEAKVILPEDEASALAFTRVLSARVGESYLEQPTWAKVLLKVIKVISAQGKKGRALVQELNINSKDREYEGQGFKFIPELGISIQGQSAPDAWREAARLAKKWKIEVWVDFVWRDNPKARHPGEHGLMRITAKTAG